MSQPAHSILEDPSFLGRLLARLDRLPGFGGGRTHVFFLGLFFIGNLMFYLLVLKLRGPASTINTWTEWDRAFTFAPGWIWLYMSPYIIGPVLVGVFSRPAFAWYIRRGTIVFLVSMVIFAALPTRTLRPLEDANPEKAANEAKLGDDLTAKFYLQTVAIDDPPANAAPSLHVSLSCLMAWALAYDRPRWKWAALAAAVLIWLSTLFTAQHHLIDVGTGALLASLAAIGRPRSTSS